MFLFLRKLPSLYNGNDIYSRTFTDSNEILESGNFENHAILNFFIKNAFKKSSYP